VRFAHFAHVWGKQGYTPRRRYEELWRELEVADAHHFDYGFCVEHHFRPDESWMSAPTLYAVSAGARTKHLRLGAMGFIASLHHPLRLAEEIAIADQMIGGRLEFGLVPGILPSYFAPFGIDFGGRREVTLETARFLKTAFTNGGQIDFDGEKMHHHGFALGVNALQQPHPPMWMETRDAPTLAFCAEHGLHTGYFFVFSRKEAHERYAPYLAAWKKHGHPGTPNIAYSTVVYVDETDEKAMATAKAHAGVAYRGFFDPTDDPAELRKSQEWTADYFRTRGEERAAEVFLNMLDPDWLVEKDLVLIGSPETVARKLKAWAAEGSFNTFFGEFNFGQLKEAEILRSIRLFGTEVIPRLRDYEPFS
jgi:alkanesulfonate monooxygenase SsuD/methylene tetrahydromethanopterin reductase-like flavin-dependent oxidoreductase (luciferase family)